MTDMIGPVDTIQRRRTILGLALAAIAVVLPFVLDRSGLFILTEIVILGIFGISFNWAFGFTEIYSFGHAAFFGIGAYAFGISLQFANLPLSVSLLAVPIGAVLFALLVGTIATRGGGIYFALLTFAFAQGLYELVIRTPNLTGASQGIFLTLPDAPLGLDLTNELHVYYIALVVLAVTLAFGYRLLHSPLGHVMKAISQDPKRTEAIGYPVRRIRIIVFTISGVFSAFAGALLALQTTFVRPGLIFYERSIEVLVIVILGGVSSHVGPLAGAAFLVLSEELVSDLANVGTILIGVLFIVVIIFVPGGAAGVVTRIRSWIRRRRD